MLKRNFLWFLIGFFLVFLFFFGKSAIDKKEEIKEFSATELYQAIEKNTVEEMEIVLPSGKISGILKAIGSKPGQKFTARVTDPKEVEKAAVAKGIKVKVTEESSSVWTTILTWLLFIGIFIFLFFWLMGRQANIASGKGLKLFPKTDKFDVEQQIKTRFSDVAGCDEIVEEAREVVDFLINPQIFKQVGVRVPKGLLLTGPPGTGKTLLARAIAGEAGVPFLAMSGSDFVELFVGVGAARVRELFAAARKHIPCIVFMDEIDALGRQRRPTSLNDEREQTLNALLSEIDGFEESTGILVIAATNRPEIVDSALLRSGRFDRQLTLPLPDVKGREAILKVHLHNRRLAEEVNLEEIARMTPGFSGADLENLANEAAIISVRQLTKKIPYRISFKDQKGQILEMKGEKILIEKKNEIAIAKKDFEDAYDKITLGPERKVRVIPEKERKIAACHEAGHVIAAYYSPNADPVRKVTIIPRGQSGGLTHFLPAEDRHIFTKDYLTDQLVVLMAGRVGEILTVNQESSGARKDFEHATGIARAIVCEFGMSRKIGKVIYSHRENFLGGVDMMDCSPQTKQLIEEEIKQLLDEAYDKAVKISRAHQDELEKLTQALLEKETLDAKEIKEILNPKTC